MDVIEQVKGPADHDTCIDFAAVVVRAWIAIGLVVVASAGAAGRFTPSVPPDA